MYKLNITNKDLKNINIEDTNKYIKYIEKLTNIKWKIIPNYENYYIISEYGNIISIRSKKILKPFLNKGYYQIHLYKDTIKKTFLVHRLVYFAFIKSIDIKGFNIYHKDKNKINNHYSNLQKMTKSKHSKYHCNQKFEKCLNKYKEYYKLRFKNHVATKKIIKKYNISKTTITLGIQKYKIKFI